MSVNIYCIGTFAHLIVTTKVFDQIVEGLIEIGTWMNKVPNPGSADRRVLLETSRLKMAENENTGNDDIYLGYMEIVKNILGNSGVNWMDFGMLLIEEDKSSPS